MPGLFIRESADLARFVKQSAASLGLNHCAITGTDLGEHEVHLINWLKDGFHGTMDYMERHGTLRSRPGELLPGTIRVISIRLDYFPPASRDAQSVLDDHQSAYISRYALGRDYHKVLRKRLQQLADLISDRVGTFTYRAFTDSAPILEKALAEKAGLGWIGKHSNLLNAEAGSWFFLGELFTDLPLAVDPPQEQEHCGSCTAFIDACPTDAIVAPYRVDARRCISYLTIERKQSIPVEFRKAMGNRIYGCDDCQLVCPFNKFSSASEEQDFKVRHQLDDCSLVSLFGWSEEQFEKNMAGSAIYRIGHERWLRNIAVALGNASQTRQVIESLQARLDHPSAMVREHVQWALAEHNVSV
ncbi:MAG: tRNA epoxyqueuosine(34) reductase QueG [Granulosicoccus sp.]|nr:tRNA epoxyqueuosine(34) reductase QueG [Granulosicoccus sp.]